MRKKELELILSKLKGFSKPKFYLEQYETPSDIASTLLWYAFLDGNIENKTIADIGAGTGILGIGALLLNAKKVFFVEKDKEAIEILKENLSLFNFKNYEIINNDYINFNEKVDTIIANPPFGRQSKEGKKFIELLKRKNFNTAYIIWEEAKMSYLKKVLKNFLIVELEKLKFPIKPKMEFHTKRKHYFNALILKLIPKDNF